MGDLSRNETIVMQSTGCQNIKLIRDVGATACMIRVAFCHGNVRGA